MGLHICGRHAHGRRARSPAAPQARRRVADRHRLGRRLQGVARARAGTEHAKPGGGHAPLTALPASGPVPRRCDHLRARRRFDRVPAALVVHARPRAGRPAARGDGNHAPLRQAGERRRTSRSSAPQLEAATGDRIYFVPVDPGIDLFPGPGPHLRRLPKSAIDFAALSKGAARCSSTSSFRARTRRGSRLRGR